MLDRFFDEFICLSAELREEYPILFSRTILSVIMMVSRKLFHY